MSLINEALKKAQTRDGNGPAANPPPGGPPPSPPRGSSGPSVWTLIGIFSIIALVLGVGSSLVVWSFLGDERSEEDRAREVVRESVHALPTEPTPAAEPVTPSPAPAASSGPIAQAQKLADQSQARAAETDAMLSAEASEPSSPKATPVTTTSSANVTQKATEAAVTAKPVAPAPVEPEETAPRGETDPAVVRWVNNIQIRGIMMGGRKVFIFDPKLGNGQAYEVGSMVNNELQVVLEKIDGNRITFKDHAGIPYIKYF